jgi:hypothetical protein
MTLASSGEMSIGGTTANRSINVELGLSPTANSNLNQANFRSLAGAGGSGTQINMSDFWGKSARSFPLGSLASIEGYEYPGASAFAYYVFNSDGTTNKFSSGFGNAQLTNWTTPTTGGIGSSYWIRFTQTAGFGGSTETGSGRGIWNQLSGNPSFGLQRGGNGAGSRTYTVQIASDSGGSNIVATTSVTISVEIIF